MPELERDENLIARCLEHDEEAWRTLVERYASYVHTIAVRAFGFNEEDAREVLQESMVKVFEGLPGYRGEGTFRAWLRQVVLNVCAAHLRRVRPGEALSDRMADRGQEEMLEQTERAHILALALRELDEPCQQIVALFFFQGKSYKEIADALAIPEGTVASRLARCLMKLRSKVQQVP